MVHHDKRYDTIGRAAQEKNGVAVLGILFHITKDPNPIIEKLLENSQRVFDSAGSNTTYRDQLLLSELLPRSTASYFRYEGSLTTPGKNINHFLYIRQGIVHLLRIAKYGYPLPL